MQLRAKKSNASINVAEANAFLEEDSWERSSTRRFSYPYVL